MIKRNYSHIVRLSWQLKRQEGDEMKKCYWINRKDILNIGYYFWDRNDEKKYLENVNHEFAQRVGEEIMKLLSSDEQSYIYRLSPEEGYKVVKRLIPDTKERVDRIRRTLLEERRQKRKELLLRGSTREAF